MYNREEIDQNMKFLSALSKRFTTIQKVSSEIINLNAILKLPKSTEHFVSDIHGEHEAFVHILNSASGVIREKIQNIYGETLSDTERDELATLIYYPVQKLHLRKEKKLEMQQWYYDVLIQLIEICKLVASKYTRSKVRKSLPEDFAYIIDELLHARYEEKNKQSYYNKIIKTVIDTGASDAFIVAMADTIKRLAVDRLHIIGDIYDRGARADIVMDTLMNHHSVDIQWGNHDILWMGAAAGSDACIANVMNISLRFGCMDMLEMGYGISLRPLITFAAHHYGESSAFTPKQFENLVEENDKEVITKMRKAICIIMLKLEGQAIKRNPNFDMQNRLLLDKIDYKNKTVIIDGVTHNLKDTDLPTVNPDNPYELTTEERNVVKELRRAFLQSEKLQKHISFLYNVGSVYKCYNSNLLYHGCVPTDKDGSFSKVKLEGRFVSGKELLDTADRLARHAYYAKVGSVAKQEGQDFIWYMWCGSHSPLFGRHAMTTFERLFIADESAWKERKDPYYSFIDSTDYCKKIMVEFGLDPEKSHIINGHMPVKIKDGESPLKAKGMHINIDGGFCRHYQSTTGIAGYTLTYNSYCLRLMRHSAFETTDKAIYENHDINSESEVIETVQKRLLVEDTDIGDELKIQIEDLNMLLDAYKLGMISEVETYL